MEIRLNKSNNNPFYGMKNCLALMQNADGTITEGLLASCFNECKTLEQRQLLFSLIFSIGDITSRQHNIFKKVPKDNGGNANREGFFTAMNWMWNNHREQFLKFLNAGLFEEYTCFDHLLRNRIKTCGIEVERVINAFATAEYRTTIAKHLYSIIKGNNAFNKMLVAKFLSLPRLSKRKGHKSMLPETRKIMEDKVKLLIELSKLAGWEYDASPSYANFKGYRAWRKQYNQDLESVLFSTKKINDFDEVQFIDWFDKLPALARARVENRISCDGSKWPEAMKEWVGKWHSYKESKQEEQRILEEKIRQGQATEDDKAKLEIVKKEAKVNVGATGFKQLYEDILRGNIDKLKLESFINKINLPYNSLVIIDDSGSMFGAPFNFATFIASVCLCKNPDDDARNLLGFFNFRPHWHSFIDAKCEPSSNRFMRKSIAEINPVPFVDPHKSFFENYVAIKDFCDAVFQGGGTDISSIPEGLAKECKENPQILDSLKSYPIWTIISDGCWNQMPSPEASMNDFMRKCENLLGFKPFVVAIDINDGLTNFPTAASRFCGIDNMIYIPSNIAQIEQFLTNFKDMEVFDAYTPLQSMHRSNRYELIRNNVL